MPACPFLSHELLVTSPVQDGFAKPPFGINDDESMSRPGTDEFYTVSRREARSKSVGYIPRRGRANSILPQAQIKSVILHSRRLRSVQKPHPATTRMRKKSETKRKKTVKQKRTNWKRTMIWWLHGEKSG